MKEEQCRVSGAGPLFGTGEASYVVRRGEVVDCTLPHPPAAAADRLYLVSVSGAQPFRPLYEALGAMSFYNVTRPRAA